ncbi:MAG: hypothetical protein AAF702_48110 [Chloroflexota bacterium]
MELQPGQRPLNVRQSVRKTPEGCQQTRCIASSDEQMESEENLGFAITVGVQYVEKNLPELFEVLKERGSQR